jgi:hypothetical protein
MESNKNWQKSSAKVFWAEIAPTDHVVQIYENDENFLDLLLGFVSGGLMAEECTIVIGTQVHLTSLNDKLRAQGFDIDQIIKQGYYVPMDAEEALAKFMVNDWPDQNLFIQLVTDLISGAKRDRKPVRAFGEMVAILWAKGQVGATVRLEQLWDKFCQQEGFCLFCAYPKSGFTQDASESLAHICSAHSKMITNGQQGMTDVYFQDVDQRTVGY